MAETTDRARLGREDVLFEEAFLLQVQCCIQGLLNDKRLKYRDLSKRLCVSEAYDPARSPAGLNLIVASAAACPDIATTEALLHDTQAQVTAIFDKIIGPCG